MDPMTPQSQLVRTTLPHEHHQTEPFETPVGWTIVAVEWHAETVDVTWLAPLDEQAEADVER